MESSACKQNGPPTADYPRYSSTATSYSDLINYDIKIPGEHTIKGESFDAEIQMFHIHPTANRQSSIGVLVRATHDGYNSEFQEIIDEFQMLYDDHAGECARRKLAFWDFLETEGSSPTKDPTKAPTEAPTNSPTRQPPHHTRNKLHDVKFNPYSEALMPTIFFYRYDGSITEPPCKDITWWVMTDPMIISFSQLNQIKRILFTHVNQDCQPTSVHNADQSVARPIYPRDTREIQDCSVGSFLSDEAKKVGTARKCRGV